MLRKFFRPASANEVEEIGQFFSVVQLFDAEARRTPIPWKWWSLTFPSVLSGASCGDRITARVVVCPERTQGHSRREGGTFIVAEPVGCLDYGVLLDRWGLVRPIFPRNTAESAVGYHPVPGWFSFCFYLGGTFSLIVCSVGDQSPCRGIWILT